MARQAFLFQFAQIHAEFRLPELESASGLHGFEIDLSGLDITRPFAVLEVTEEQARLLARRCILIKSVYEFYARGTSYAALHENNRTNSAHLWDRFVEDTSFKFSIIAYMHTIPQRRQREVVETFSYMGFKGKIDMKNPDIVLCCFEEYHDRALARSVHEGDGNFREVFFGRLIEEGSARPLVHTFDVKKRAYFGNTSMEAEISLLMANQALSAPGKLIYDPFVGTGSMLYTVAHFGALVFGSDIDGRQMRGKEHVPGIVRAATQYGVEKRVLDLATFDVTQNPLRSGALFDAIITDPPYGVRAGAKRIGRKKERVTPVVSRSDLGYVPPTKPYELSELARDLVLLARHLLVPGGRLVFFLPTVNEAYQEVDIRTMLCDGMELVANSLQDFGSWGRRLITIKKTTNEVFPRPSFDPEQAVVNSDSTVQDHAPAHKNFREHYFARFGKGPAEAVKSGDPSTTSEVPQLDSVEK